MKTKRNEPPPGSELPAKDASRPRKSSRKVLPTLPHGLRDWLKSEEEAGRYKKGMKLKVQLPSDEQIEAWKRERGLK